MKQLPQILAIDKGLADAMMLDIIINSINGKSYQQINRSVRPYLLGKNVGAYGGYA